jgi:hypothetical protein
VALVEINRTPSHTELRWFGVIVLVFFAILGGIALWQFESVRWSGILCGAGLILAAAYYGVRPLRLPLYLMWMHAVAPIGWLLSHAVLAIVYFGIVAPTGLLMRPFGRDALRRGFEPTRDSYWTEHDPGTETARYFRQT